METRKTTQVLLLIALTAGIALAHASDREAPGRVAAEQAPAGWMARGFARLEHLIGRLEARLAGRNQGGTTGGCESMAGGGMSEGMMSGGMMEGGMMGGTRPNERWRGPADRR